MDASSIALLYYYLNQHNAHKIYTIHDCFVATANNVAILIDLHKAVYLEIYYENVYLISMHDYVKTTFSNMLDSRVFSHDYKHIYLTCHGVTIKISYPYVSDIIDITISIDKSKL